ncbi:MAG: thermonuclease family protein [Patescibacteria group bacterium]
MLTTSSILVKQWIVKQWLDGDTVEITAIVDIVIPELDVRVSLSLDRNLRIYGLDTPEMHSKNKEEKARGEAALRYAESLAPPGSIVNVKIAKGKDKYKRFLAKITLPDGDDFAGNMLLAGHGTAYYGGKKNGK